MDGGPRYEQNKKPKGKGEGTGGNIHIQPSKGLGI